MAMCPLLKKECIREQCAWWHEATPEEDSGCAMALLPELLEGVWGEIGGLNAALYAGMTSYTQESNE